MASTLTITVGGRTYTKNFNRPDAEVRQILRNFGATMEPALPEGATIQQEVDNIGDKIIAMITQIATSYDTQKKREVASTTVQEQAILDNKLT